MRAQGIGLGKALIDCDSAHRKVVAAREESSIVKNIVWLSVLYVVCAASFLDSRLSRTLTKRYSNKS